MFPDGAFLFPQLDDTGILELLDQQQKDGKEDHSAYSQEAESHIHRQKGADGR